MKKYIYTIVAATAMLASCSQDAELNEVIDNQPKAITEIGATTSAETRAVVSSSDNTKVNWETDDQIGVFGTNSSSEAVGPTAYSLNGAGGSTSGTFKNASSTITAVQAMMYPYQNTATWADNKLTCEIPTVQTATAGSFDKNAAIMYSIGSSTNATLNYAVNFLKVSVTETNVHAITIGSNDWLSGTVKLTSTGVEEGTAKSVTLVASGGTSACLETGDYYIAVKKGNITNPSISYTYINSTAHTAVVKTKAGSSTLTFADGKNVKPISVNFGSGTVSERKAVQLWADGPYFATANAGNMSWNAGRPARGSAWTIASETDLTNLYTDSYATKSWTQENSTWGFKFTGTADGYTGNSLFLPSDGGGEYDGSANYWSSTEAGTDKARYVYLCYDSGFYSYWDSDGRTYDFFVRLVLR